MKKLIFLFSFMLIGFMTVYAQKNVKPLQSDTTIHKLGLDTNINAATVSQMIQIPGIVSQLTFQTKIVKLTGSPAGGVVKLMGSVDNDIYDYVASPDSLLLTNAVTQVKTWKLKPSDFQYYKLVYKGAGTQTTKVNTKVLSR